MRRRIILAGLLAAVSVPAVGAEKKEKTLRERIQGTWVRPNDVLSFSVKDNAMTEFHEDKPFEPFNTGTIEYAKDQEKAIVRLKTGHILWLFSAGPNVVAIESFAPDGKLIGIGRVYYRKGTYEP